MSLTVVTGGTRSGKSARAERLAGATGLPVRYVATADGDDPSMAERIADHVARRPAAWTTVRAGASLADAVGDATGECVLVDGLGPWIATALHRADAFDDTSKVPAASAAIAADVDLLVAALAQATQAIVVVEQAGSGVLPLDSASRAWLDLLGAATERLATVAEHVELVVAGRVVPLAAAHEPTPQGGVRAGPPAASAAPREAPAALSHPVPASRAVRATPTAGSGTIGTDGPAVPVSEANYGGQGVPHEPTAESALRAGPPAPGPAPPDGAAEASRAVPAYRAVRATATASGRAAPSAPYEGRAEGGERTAPDGAPGARSPVPHEPGPQAPERTAPPDAAALRRHGDRDVRPGDADHTVNVVAGGPPDWLRDALDAALDAGAATYPREDAAIAALAGRHGRDPAEVVPTNGGAEALWLLGPALRPRLAAVVHPQFTEAEAALHAHGIRVVRVLRDPERHFALDPTQVPDDADLVIVGNPASPSGTLDPATAILALRRPGRTVVVDEAFMDLVPGEPGSLAAEQLEDVIVVRSLTKVLGVPGLRAGYALAPPPLADRLRAVRPPWSANALALAALTAATRRPGELDAIAERAATERDDLTRRLRAIPGVRVWPGAANFVLVAVDDGPRVVATLREQAIAVRPAASFPGLDDRHLRITARDGAANARLADALAVAVVPEVTA